MSGGVMQTRRIFIKKGFIVASTFLNLPNTSNVLTTSAQQKTASAAEDLYRRAIIIDTSVNDGPLFDAKRAIDDGLTAVVVDLSAFPRNLPNALQALTQWNAMFRKQDSGFVKVLKVLDIEAAKRQKKLGIILACQDASILDASTTSVDDYNIQNLYLFYDLGLRALQLTHNERNAVGDSFREKSNAGLSRLGEKVVEEMNSLGMLIDLSHCSDQTTLEAIRLSKKPCAITHAGCRTLYPTLRNKSDEQIRALSERGGVIGIFNMSLYLTDREATTIDDVVSHIDHAVKVGGIDHVSFGSDGPVLELLMEEELKGHQVYAKRNLGLPGAERIPSHVRVRELNSPKRLFNLGEALSKRGYKDDAIEKIIGGNFVRLFRDVCG
jgi:membrane dipeptidase